ncbi:MAG: ABATE domain-containing protein [Candidatus Sulfotelmatobacter sp.]
MKEAKSKTQGQKRFDLIAGNVCLDFVNTLDDRHIKPKELLVIYDDLLQFGEDAGLLDAAQRERLSRRNRTEPDRAQDALRRARDLRESIHDVFWAVIENRRVPSEALAKLNREIQIAAEHLRLAPANGRFHWRFADLTDFDVLRWRIARYAADLLASDELPFVRACSSKECEWFFLDTSKNHHRRWCDMKRCGNRAKVRRFYEKNKTA